MPANHRHPAEHAAETLRLIFGRSSRSPRLGAARVGNFCHRTFQEIAPRRPQSMTPSHGDLTLQLEEALIELLLHPSPHVPNPPDCPKRASTAVIIRIRPPFDRQADATFIEPVHGFYPSESSQSIENVRQFFSTEWVKNGDPEILFIKRAARAGDR